MKLKLKKHYKNTEHKLTEWEAFNYILKGLTDEMIQNLPGVGPEVRITVFKLWAHYMKKNKAAFFHKTKYALVEKMKKPQDSLKRSILYIILFIALNHHKSPIQVSDFLRFIREGHFSYISDCHQFLPKNLNDDEKIYIAISYTKVRIFPSCFDFCMDLQKFSLDYGVNFNHSNMYELFDRYIKELALPKKFVKLTEKLYNFCKPEFEFSKKRNVPIPLYEIRAVAYIILILKLLFGLNGFTEDQMSESTKQVNLLIEKKNLKLKKLFVLSEWMEYFTTRKILLQKYCGATPNELERNDLNSSEVTENYLNHSNRIIKNMEIPRSTTVTFKRKLLLNLHSDIRKKYKHKKTFIECPASLTPLTSNFEKVLSEINNEEVPENLQEDCRKRDIDYLLDHTKLREKLESEGYRLKIEHASDNPNIKILKDSEKLFKSFRLRYGIKKYYSIYTNIEENSFINKVRSEAIMKKILQLNLDFSEETKKEFSEYKKLVDEQMNKRRKFSENSMFDSNFQLPKKDDDCDEDDPREIIKLLRPNFNYWTLLCYSYYHSGDISSAILDNLPVSYKWLLENCSTMLGIPWFHIQYEVMILETQFLYILQPLYEMDDKLLYQDVEKLNYLVRKNVKRFSKRYSKCLWRK